MVSPPLVAALRSSAPHLVRLWFKRELGANSGNVALALRGWRRYWANAQMKLEINGNRLRLFGSSPSYEIHFSEMTPSLLRALRNSLPDFKSVGGGHRGRVILRKYAYDGMLDLREVYWRALKKQLPPQVLLPDNSDHLSGA